MPGSLDDPSSYRASVFCARGGSSLFRIDREIVKWLCEAVLSQGARRDAGKLLPFSDVSGLERYKSRSAHARTLEC